MIRVPGLPIAVAFLAAALGAPSPVRAADSPAPAVVVTVKPLHALVAGVMKGVGEPALLYGAGPAAGPLDDAKKALLAKARVLFWLDKAQAPAVAAAIAGRTEDLAVVGLLRAPGVRLMDARQGHRRVAAPTARPQKSAPPPRKTAPQLADGNVVFRKRGAPTAKAAPRPPRRAPARNRRSTATPPDKIATPDPRIWLDPRNAIAVVRAAADALARADPANAARYRRNAAVMAVRIEALNDGMTATMRALRKARYAVANNALQYFEDHYVMTPALEFRLVSLRPEAAAVSAARRQIAAAGLTCVLAPTALAPDSARGLVAGTKARLARLDVYGGGTKSGPDGYFALMQGIVGKIAACLR
jgi:zinc transport system substrate-binding protein